jgi:hypothetical protein
MVDQLRGLFGQDVKVIKLQEMGEAPAARNHGTSSALNAELWGIDYDMPSGGIVSASFSVESGKVVDSAPILRRVILGKSIEEVKAIAKLRGWRLTAISACAG